MQRPVHQLALTILAYVSAAVLVAGSLLEAFINAREVFSPAITFVGSLVLLLIWITAATWVRQQALLAADLKVMDSKDKSA